MSASSDVGFRIYDERGRGKRWFWGWFKPQTWENNEICANPFFVAGLEFIETVAPSSVRPAQFYVFHAVDGARKTTSVLSLRVICRLWHRFVQNSHDSCSCPASTNHRDENRVHCANAISCTGHAVPDFQRALKACVIEKSVQLRSGRGSTMYSVSPSFYEMWKAITHFDTELFADAMNESGAATAFCSLDLSDSPFGSRGKWTSDTDCILGGVGNPPYEQHFIASMIAAFEKRVRQSRPFFRSCILPASPSYMVSDVLDAAEARGRIIAFYPAHEVGFVHQSILLSTSQETHFGRPLRNQSLFICAWVNASYLALRPPPRDVEDAFTMFIVHSCRNHSMAQVNYDSLRILFPEYMRSSNAAMDIIDPIFH